MTLVADIVKQNRCRAISDVSVSQSLLFILLLNHNTQGEKKGKGSTQGMIKRSQSQAIRRTRLNISLINGPFAVPNNHSQRGGKANTQRQIYIALTLEENTGAEISLQFRLYYKFSPIHLFRNMNTQFNKCVYLCLHGLCPWSACVIGILILE